MLSRALDCRRASAQRSADARRGVGEVGLVAPLTPVNAPSVCGTRPLLGLAIPQGPDVLDRPLSGSVTASFPAVPVAETGERGRQTGPSSTGGPPRSPSLIRPGLPHEPIPEVDEAWTVAVP